jgi:hypothetical protein
MGASAASREAACLAAVRRGAVQSTRARERDEEVGCGTRRAPGAEVEERRGKVRLIPYWTMIYIYI